MLRLHQIRLTLADAAQDELPCRALAAARLRVPEAEILSARIARRSVDARDRRDVYFSLSLDVTLASPQTERTLVRRFAPNQAALLDAPKEYDAFSLPVRPYGEGRPRPVVIGAGPAGCSARWGSRYAARSR